LTYFQLFEYFDCNNFLFGFGVIPRAHLIDISRLANIIITHILYNTMQLQLCKVPLAKFNSAHHWSWAIWNIINQKQTERCKFL